ncbi:MAG: EVE domain-containing protein [Inquilinus sp.]|nr:EVE domain-containing protein [Inquilinus sp.]
MAYWLVKSEPNSWSWDQQVAKDVEVWDGVRNHQAKNNLLAMRLGDLAFFYHSVEGKEIVGIVVVAAEAHPDPTDPTGKWFAVDFQAVRPFVKPVPLEQIKNDPRLADMVLVKNSRLSVQPVTGAEWQLICGIGETDSD